MVATPLLVDVRAGAVEGLAGLLADQRISAHGQVAVVVGPGQGEQIADVLRTALRNAEVTLVENGDLEAAHGVADRLRQGSFDAVVGIGGGRTLDVAKYAASIVGLPMVAVATSLTHDGLASPVASLEHRGHKGSYGVHIPLAVVVDLDYARRAPLEHLRAGLGDLLSNLSAVADWELAARERGEPIDGLAVALARAGAEALLNSAHDLTSPDFLQPLGEGLILGGISMAIAGSSRPCSGACHEIAHAIDARFPGAGPHGAEVAVGALFATWLRGGPALAEVEACLRRHGAARVPADLGLSAEQFAVAVAEAPATRPDRYTILEHLDLGEAEIRERVDEFIATYDR
jgi:glycerol-1-phosphate dehydrogenase [NAD(P)+]